MDTLAEPESKNACLTRLARLDSTAKPGWGRMTAHQIVIREGLLGADGESIGLHVNLSVSIADFVHTCQLPVWLAWSGWRPPTASRHDQSDSSPHHNQLPA